MKSLGHFLLLAGLSLLTATLLPAQHFVSGGAAPSFNGGYGGGYGGGFGGYGYAGYGWGYSSWGFGDCDLHHPQEHPPFGTGAAHGDPDFIQSTYMDYNKAVELGNKILAEQAKPQPSLGEIARQFRARSRSYLPPPAPTSRVAPSGASRKVILLQQDGGPLVFCRGTDAACRDSA